MLKIWNIVWKYNLLLIIGILIIVTGLTLGIEINHWYFLIQSPGYLFLFLGHGVKPKKVEKENHE